MNPQDNEYLVRAKVDLNDTDTVEEAWSAACNNPRLMKQQVKYLVRYKYESKIPMFFFLLATWISLAILIDRVRASDALSDDSASMILAWLAMFAAVVVWLMIAIRLALDYINQSPSVGYFNIAGLMQGPNRKRSSNEPYSGGVTYDTDPELVFNLD